MRSFDAATMAATRSRQGVIPRDLVWIEAKAFGQGSGETLGVWNGDENVDLAVVSGATGLSVARTYVAAGSLLSVDSIPLRSDLTVQNIQITLSQINQTVQNAVRGYDVRLAPIEVHRAYFDLQTRLLVAPPRPRFVGWVNSMQIATPAAGGEGSVTLSCVSHTRALTKTNPAKRSDETQRLRGDDRFRRYSGVAGQWSVFWGENKG